MHSWGMHRRASCIMWRNYEDGRASDCIPIKRPVVTFHLNASAIQVEFKTFRVTLRPNDELEKPDSAEALWRGRFAARQNRAKLAGLFCSCHSLTSDPDLQVSA